MIGFRAHVNARKCVCRHARRMQTEINANSIKIFKYQELYADGYSIIAVLGAHQTNLEMGVCSINP